MVCCLNPTCDHPQNAEGTKFCHSCGTTLGFLRNHYHIIDLLSDEGRFGRTYLAEDIDKPKPEPCVVKQLAPKVQGTGAIQKSIQLFKEEAHRLQEMGMHPQIPTLNAYFEENNYLYLVQEWIQGQTLTKLLQQPWSENEIRGFLLDILPVLQFIHQQPVPVIHRDIKPANIIRRQSDGKFVLIDFGASKQLAATVIVNQGTRIGTNGYSPYEQMLGGEAYPASDLFSVGATCFHLLTQVDPYHLFLNEGYSWVQNWRQYLQQAISTDLGDVLDKLLQKDYQKRYQSAVEVITDLTLPTIPLAIPTLPKPPSAFFLKTTLSGHSYSVNSVAFSPDGQYLASGSWDTTIKIWQVATWKLYTTLSGHSYSVNSVAFSPDGQYLASSSDDNTIKIWQVATGQVHLTLSGHSDWANSVAFSPDGQYLASGSDDNTIKIWQVATGQLQTTLKGNSIWIRSVAFSPDGQYLASGSRDTTIKIWQVATGQLQTALKGHLKWVRCVAFSPNGKYLASGSIDETLKIWEVATRQLHTTLEGHFGWVKSVAFSPDGEYLASGSFDTTIRIWHVPK